MKFELKDQTLLKADWRDASSYFETANQRVIEWEVAVDI
jgi:hypothetical protein